MNEWNLTNCNKLRTIFIEKQIFKGDNRLTKQIKQKKKSIHYELHNLLKELRKHAVEL